VNCGLCGKACPLSTSYECSAGVCLLSSGCPLGKSRCVTGSGYGCASLQTDPFNCGGCGIACTTGQLCIKGACQAYTPAVGCTTCPCTACPAPTTTCCPALTGHKNAICVAGTACP
jgi:hypothetical protein